jgi:hypothetical protein
VNERDPPCKKKERKRKTTKRIKSRCCCCCCCCCCEGCQTNTRTHTHSHSFSLIVTRTHSSCASLSTASPRAVLLLFWSSSSNQKARKLKAIGMRSLHQVCGLEERCGGGCEREREWFQKKKQKALLCGERTFFAFQNNTKTKYY